jgi:hypothetical protein
MGKLFVRLLIEEMKCSNPAIILEGKVVKIQLLYSLFYKSD